MPDKVLIYSRFPKAMMVRIGERFELMDAARQAAARGVHGGTARRRPRDDHGRRHAAAAAR